MSIPTNPRTGSGLLVLRSNPLGDSSRISPELPEDALSFNGAFMGRDYLLIGVLFSPSLLEPWIDDWQELLMPIYIAGKRTYNRDFVHLMMDLRLAFMCFTALLVAFASDLLKKHYKIWTICLEIYTGVQIYGMVIYHFGPYEAADVVWWLSSFMFVGTTVRTYIIFSQNQRPYRFRSHLVLAACELSYATSLWALYWSMLHYRHHATFGPLGYLHLLPWATITLLILIILATRTLRENSPVGNSKIPPIREHAQRIFRGIKEDSKTVAAVKFAFWASLVLPLCIPIALHTAVHRLDLNIDGSIDINKTSDHVYLLGRTFGLIILEAILFGVRKLNAKLSDVLTLGLPLILYLFVSIAIYSQLLVFRPIQDAATRSLEDQIEHAQVFLGPIPSKTQAVIEFYNVMNDSIEILSPNFTLEAPLIPYSRTSLGLNVTANIPIKVVALGDGESGNGTGWSKCLCVLSELDRFHSFIIDGNISSFGISKIYDHGKIKPTTEPVVVIMNSFMDARDEHHRVMIWEETFSKDLGYFQSYPSFATNKSIIVHAPRGGVKFIYENINEIEDFRHPDDRSTNVLVLEPFVVYSILITLQEGRVYMASFEVMRIGITKNRVNVPKIQDNLLIASALFVMGAAYSLLMVGFYHHFWMDSPCRLQATLVAGCLVSHQVTRHMVDTNIKQLEHWQALIMVILMSILVVWHFISASLYFYHFEFGYRSDEKGGETAKAKDHLNQVRQTMSPPKVTHPVHPTARRVTFNETTDSVNPIGD